jgi:hypothetical protein
VTDDPTVTGFGEAARDVEIVRSGFTTNWKVFVVTLARFPSVTITDTDAFPGVVGVQGSGVTLAVAQPWGKPE